MAPFAKGHVVKRWIFNYSTDQAELVEGSTYPIDWHNPALGSLFYRDENPSRFVNYKSTYSTERECLEDQAESCESAAAAHQSTMETAKADRDNCRALARKLRKRIAALS